jgi:hypothetical protein
MFQVILRINKNDFAKSINQPIFMLEVPCFSYAVEKGIFSFRRNMSRDGVVGIATGYKLEFESRYGQEFSPLHVIQTVSGAHPASYPMGTVGSFPGVKRTRCEADRSPPSSAEVKKMWIYTSTPHKPS